MMYFYIRYQYIRFLATGALKNVNKSDVTDEVLLVYLHCKQEIAVN